jgi:hypothetical protein
MPEIVRDTPETRAAMAAILKAVSLAASVQRRLVISDQVGWPADVAGDLAEGRRLLRVAEVELGAAAARERFEARYGR